MVFFGILLLVPTRASSVYRPNKHTESRRGEPLAVLSVHPGLARPLTLLHWPQVRDSFRPNHTCLELASSGRRHSCRGRRHPIAGSASSEPLASRRPRAQTYCVHCMVSTAIRSGPTARWLWARGEAATGSEAFGRRVFPNLIIFRPFSSEKLIGAVSSVRCAVRGRSRW